MKSRLVFKWLALATVMLLACAMNRGTLQDINEELRRVRPEVLAACGMFSALYFVEEGRIIHTLARKYNRDFTWRQGTFCALYCSFYRILTFGSGAGVAQVYYLNTKGIPAAKGTGMSLVQYSIQRMAISLYGVAGCILIYVRYPELLGGYRYYLLAGILAAAIYIAAILVICTWRRGSDRIFVLAGRVAGSRAKWIEKIGVWEMQTLALQEEAAALLKDRQRFLHVFVINIVKMTCWYIIPGIVLFSKEGLEISTSLMMTSIVFMLATVMLVPSGIGAMEFAFVIFYAGIADAETLVLALVVYRLMVTVIPFAVGGVCVGVNRKKDR